MPQSQFETEGTGQSPRGCFRRLCCGWDDGGYLLQESGGGILREQESWLVTQLKKLKHLSEVIAGPKWKNTVRKIGKLCKCRRSSKDATAQQFQYSPESYALNFAGDEDDNLLHSFSTRFGPQSGAF